MSKDTFMAQYDRMEAMRETRMCGKNRTANAVYLCTSYTQDAGSHLEDLRHLTSADDYSDYGELMNRLEQINGKLARLLAEIF